MNQFQILSGNCAIRDNYLKINSHKVTKAKRLLTNSFTLQAILTSMILYIILSITLNTSVFIKEVAINGLFSGLFLAVLLLLGESLYNKYLNISDKNVIELESIQQVILSKPNKIGHAHVIIQYHENDSERIRILQLMPTWSKIDTDDLSDVENILVRNNLNVKYCDDLG